MVAPLKQREVAISRETSFGSGEDDWDAIATGGKFYALEVAPEFYENKTENENLRSRASDTPEGIVLPKTVACPLTTYLYGAQAPAADQAQAARLVRDELLLNALQGETLGYRADITGGVDTAPTTTPGVSDAQASYTWGFFFDTSEGAGHFRKLTDVTLGGGGDNTANMAAGHALPFTPAAGDVMHATVVHFPDWDLLEDHAEPQVSHAIFIRGKDPAHIHEAQGIRFGVEVGEVASGTPTKLDFTAMGVDFTDPERYDGADLVVPTLAGTPEGNPSTVPGRGSTTRVWIADVGANLGAQQFWGSITPTLGIKPDPSEGPNGRNGIHGFGVSNESYDATGVEVMVPRERFWKTDFRAGTHKHMLIQVGDQPGNTWFLYFPRLELRDEPKDADHRGRDAYTLTFKAREANVSTIGLTTTEAHRARAKFEIGRVG
ncbi:MAG: hypothetical protein ACRBN8_22430 [Nannocystales bacterium]